MTAEHLQLEEMFYISMDRAVASFIWVPGLEINLGHGSKRMPAGVESVGLPEWNAETDSLPYESGTVSTVWALHFLEHIQNLTWVMRECQRVLRKDGVVNICVPYGTCHMAVQDPDHKRFFNEDTWRHMFANPYYDTGYGANLWWDFSVRTQWIMGVKGENLALITQLQKS